MERAVNRQRSVPLPLLFVGGVALTVGLALVIFSQLLRPPLKDIEAMTAFLSVTAGISIAVGYSAYRLNWVGRLPHLSWTLLGSYVLSSVLTFVNVWVTARLMFVSEYDLLLATVLLLFASGIATSLGYFFSASLTDRIATLNEAAASISQGNLDVRVQSGAQDELADLARTFNEMAARLEEAARKQSELEMLRRDLIAWVGHDLQTPLASIRAILETLSDRVVEDPTTVKRYLKTGLSEIRALSLLVDDLFEMAQIDAGGLRLDVQPGSVSELVADTARAFSAQAERKRIALRSDVAPGTDPVMMDVSRMRRVLGNLLDNALRHTATGGTVDIRAFRVDDGVRVEVCDDGEGIEADDLKRIFERFYRGDKSRSSSTGGAGLGLAIALGIVEAHGGHIEAESTPGSGTCVSFILPTTAMESSS